MIRAGRKQGPYRPRTEETLDAGRLELGEDFQDAECLLISEVKALLEAQYESKKKEKNLTDVYTKTLEYVQKFSRYTNRNTIKEVRALLKPTNLEPFECAQLGNLCCTEYDEIKSLVPSIGDKISDDDLDSLLKQLDSLKKYQGWFSINCQLEKSINYVNAQSLCIQQPNCAIRF